MLYLKRMKKVQWLVCFLFVLAFLFSSVLMVKAACPETDYDCQIGEIQNIINTITPAHERNKAELAKLKAQLADIQKRLNAVSAGLKQLEKSILEREVDLAFQEKLLAVKVRRYYIESQKSSPFLLLLSSSSAQELARGLAFRLKVVGQDRLTIIQIAADLKKLGEDKGVLERSQVSLSQMQKEVDGKTSFLAGEVEKVELALASLTAKQSQLLAQKLSSLNLPTSLGAGPLACVDDRQRDPGFSPAFAFFTYGIPHRVGMNQYGAYGRAKAGQSYQTILNAYYEGISLEKRANVNLTVQGYGSMPLEQYLLGIYEMPESWPIEAQKAQAVAARSYALAYTENGAKEICTTQSCQVYKGGNKGGNWEAAVRATEGEVAVHSGQVITAWYASTAGGYTYLSSDVGWSSKPWTKRMRDTSGEVASFGDLQATAYDRDSPCFYAAQGWRKEYASSAWLKSEEVADIVNVILLARADASTREHLYQTDKAHPYGGEIWNEEKVKQELRSRGITPFNNVSGVSVDWVKGLGRTTSVSVSGDAGTQSFDGPEFKNFFNLRAPANIQIVGPLFNPEKK
ncbi:MAG: SpoIID/LytB domain-containing protein [Candidatus Marinimicrobia bacterium]|nr:SpoIID/LytB domain-containing protein [Candidatus Neomarinimicrobiota bacterium]